MIKSKKDYISYLKSEKALLDGIFEDVKRLQNDCEFILQDFISDPDSKADSRNLGIFNHFEIELMTKIFENFIDVHRVNLGGENHGEQ